MIINKNNIILIFTIFYLGAIIGSFIGVILYRRPLNLDYIKDRSRCDFCDEKIPIYYNIPIFSYIYLGGKCKYCNKDINLSTLLYEIIGGMTSLIAYFKFSLTLNFFIYLVILNLIFLISLNDLKEYSIYNLDLVILSIFVFIFKFINNTLSFQNLINALIFFVVFYLIMKLSKGMGEGDVILSFIIGFSQNNIYDLIKVFQIIFILATVISILLLILKIKTRKDYIAFSPYLLFPLIFI